MEGVASKFACLQDDDSTDWVAPKEKGKKSKPANEPKPNSSKSKKKNKANNEAKELQNLAFASKKSKNKNKSKSQNSDNKSSTKQEAQYEEWKQKDEKVSNNHCCIYTSNNGHKQPTKHPIISKCVYSL